MARWCPHCGWPKEAHRKFRNVTLQGVHITRECRLIEVDMRDDGTMIYRADAEAYRRVMGS